METYVVHVTKQCNLDCVYCYETDKDSTYSWDEVKAFIDELIAMRTSNTFMIEFLGGEPTLAFHLIKQAYEYFESHEELDVQRYIITTNGTILNAEIENFLIKNRKVIFAISMDGTKTSNQMRVFRDSRLNTYDAVMRNIRILLGHGVFVQVHMVTHPYNVHLIQRSTHHLYEHGVRHIDFGIVESTINIDRTFVEEYVKQLQAISDLITSGALPDLRVGVLENLKPVDDVRTYLVDKATGKTIAESYGRSGHDVVDTEKYEVRRFENKSPETLLIEECRDRVYKYHQNRRK